MSWWRQRNLLAFVMVLTLSALACALPGLGGDEATAVPVPTEVVEVAATDTPIPPTETPEPTATSAPTETPEPEPTEPPPTETPLPEPTAEPTVKPTATTAPITQGGFTGANGEPYEMTFDNAGDWEVSEDFVGYTENGVFVFTVTEAQSIFWTYAQEEARGAGVYELQAVQTVGLDDPAYGLILGVSPDGDEFYAFEVSSDGYYSISKCYQACDEYDSFTGEDLWVSSPDVPLGLNVVHNLRVEVSRNGEMRFFDNDILLETIIDPEFSGGDIGMVVETFDGDDIVVEFDNLRFTPAAAAPQISCANEDGTLLISHDGRYYSGSDNSAIFVASTETALDDFEEGEVTMYLEANSPEALELMDISGETDPARQLQAFLGDGTLFELFSDVEIVQDVAPVQINGQRAARAEMTLNVPDSEIRYQFFIVVYGSDELAGVFAAFVPAAQVEMERPALERLINSVIIGPTAAPVCQHVPAPVGGGGQTPGVARPIEPGQIIVGERQNREVTGRYTLTAANDNELLVIVAPEDSSSDVVLRIMAGDGTLIEEVDNAISGQAETTTFVPQAGRSYTLEVSEYFDSRSAYSIAVIDVGPDSTAPLDEVDAELTEDGVFTYTWDGVVGQPIVFYLEADGNLDLTIDMFAGDGGYLDYADAGLDGEPELIVYVPAADGPVTIEIRDFSGMSGVFRLSVLAVSE